MKFYLSIFCQHNGIWYTFIILGELFDFEDDFLAPELVHATPPDPNPSVLTLPNLTLDSSDKALLIEQQANNFSLNTVRELANN